MTHEQIVARVQKLLALATSPNEHEAASAAAKAHALLAEHNLSLSEVASSNSDTDTPVGTVESTTVHGTPYERRMWSQVAKLNFCSYFYTRTYKGKILHNVVGNQANSLVACAMATYLMDTVLRLSKEARAERDESMRWRDAFRKGCADTITHRIMERIKELRSGEDATKSISNPGNLPALYDDQNKAVQAYLAKNHPNLTTAKSREGRADASAYRSGSQAGSTVSLNQQVGGSSSSARRIAAA